LRAIKSQKLKAKKFVLVVLFVLVCLTMGCEEKRKALVSAHTAMGELLLSTKNQAKALHQQKVIDDPTYQSIRTNWIRAQTSYLTASDMLEHILSTQSQDITAYAELLTQVSTILSDISLWLEENRHEPTSDHSIGNPTPTPRYEVSSGDIEGAGTQRVGQRVAAAVRAGDERQGVGGDLGKLNPGMNAVTPDLVVNDIVKQKFDMQYTAIYNARQEIFIHGIKDNTAEVLVSVLVGSVVYTLDGSEPVLTDGVPYLGIHQSLVLNAGQGRQFRAKSSMDGTQLMVGIMENLRE